MAGFLAGFGQGLLDYSNQLNQNAYKNALLQLDRQNQALKTRQALSDLAARKQQQDVAGLIARLSGGLAQPGGGSLGAGPLSGLTPMAPGVSLPSPFSTPSGGGLPASFPQVPNATGQMAAPLDGTGSLASLVSSGGTEGLVNQLIRREGSSPAGVLNNPGNIKFAGLPGQTDSGVHAKDGGTFASYATPEAGRAAIGGLITNAAAGRSSAYGPNPTVGGFTATYEGLPQKTQQRSSQVAIGAAAALPPQFAGQAGPGIFARLVERVAGSDAPDEVKGAALLQLFPYMSREGQQQFQQSWDIYKFGAQQAQQSQEFGIREQEVEANRAQTAELARERMQTTRDLVAQRQQANPAAVELQRYLDEHPNATAEDIQRFVQTGRSVRSPQSAAIAKFIQEHPDATADDIKDFASSMAGQISTTRAFDVGKQGDTIRSLNVAIDHLGVLQDATDALQNGDLRLFNSIGVHWATETGQSPPTDFAATKAIVKDEIVKAVLGSAGALGDRAEVEKTIDAANSPEQLAGVIRRYQQLMGGQMRGLKQQFITSGAGDEAAFNKKLLPGTVNALKQAAAPSGAESMAVPPAYAADPDGTGYRKDGAVWVKRGNQLIKTPGAEATQ